MIVTAGALFAGIGGFCAGFARRGITTKWALDIDERVEASYRKNYSDHRFVRCDISDVKNGYANGVELEPVDILHAGFPCQSFSMAGDRKGFDDPRGMLFFELMRVIREFKDRKPSILVFENSPYLKIGDRGNWFTVIRNEIQKACYWFKENNAVVIDPQENLGLPHFRPRLFMIAFDRSTYRSGRLNIELREEKSSKGLSNFIDFDGEISEQFPGQYYLDKENRYYGMISAKRSNSKEKLYQLRKFRVRVKDHCPTLTANMGHGGHNVPFIFDHKGLRKLTEKECLSFQGFTNFEFPDGLPSSSKYSQIGNSVHVEIATHIAEALKSKLEESND